MRQEVLRVLQATQGLCEKTRPQQARVVSLAYAMVAAGMDGPGAYLALIPGVGPILARRLLAHGITSIEDLAQVDPNRLAQMPGVALERALSWRFAAEHLLENDTLLCSDKHAEDAPALFWTDDMLGAKSDYRDVRARELTVVAMGEGVFSVSGGSEPHRVVALEAAFRCDCADFAAGHRCKHIRAVQNRCALDAPQECLDAARSMRD